MEMVAPCVSKQGEQANKLQASICELQFVGEVTRACSTPAAHSTSQHCKVPP
jgi:hypothetical protein